MLSPSPGRAVTEIEDHIVNVTPAPPLGRVVAFDHGMPGRVEVLRRVPIRRVITASDMAACSAEAQMQPGRAGFQTLLATQRARRHIANGRLMRAFVCHQGSPIVAGFPFSPAFARNACNAAPPWPPLPQ